MSSSRTTWKPFCNRASLLTAVLLPPAGTSSAYVKHRVRGIDTAIVGVGVGLTLAADGVTCESAGIGLAGVGTTPLRASNAEAALTGAALTPELWVEAGRIAAEECEPLEDTEASEWYRRKMVDRFVQRAGALAQARANGPGRALRMTMTTVGTRARRLDADGKITGHARYASDYKPAGMLYGKIVRSDRPAARIVSIDTSAAEALPGVLAVLSGEGSWRPFGEVVKDQLVFSIDKVRCAGEPLAAIAAETPEIAEMAAQLVEVEYEDLPSVFDPLEALEPGAPLVHDDVANLAGPPGLIREGNICAKVTLKRGNVESAFANAHAVIEGTYSSHSVHQAPMETRAAVTELDDVGRLVVHASTQHPFGVRQQLVDALGIGHGDVRVIAETVGGGFGSKLEAAVEIYASLLTQATGLPVRMVNSREEDFLSGVPRHPMIVELQSALDSEGRILARKGRVIMDSGAYAVGSPLLVGAAALLATGPYDIEHIEIDAYAVYTNNPPFGAYRGPTGPQMTFAVESHTDEIAKTLGVDPLSLRLLNVFKEGSLGPSGQVLTNVGMVEAVTRAAEAIGYTTRSEPVEPNHRRGKGLSAAWWLTTAGSSGCTVQMNEDGTAVVHTGATEIGTGSVMAGVAQVVAEELGIPLEQVKVKWGDTDGTPMDAGAQGSRTMYNMGNAAMQAAQDAKQQLLEKAANVLEAAEADLEVIEGRVYVKGVPDRNVSYAELMAWQMWATTPVDRAWHLPDRVSSFRCGDDAEWGYSAGLQCAVVSLPCGRGRCRPGNWHRAGDRLCGGAGCRLCHQPALCRRSDAWRGGAGHWMVVDRGIAHRGRDHPEPELRALQIADHVGSAADSHRDPGVRFC